MKKIIYLLLVLNLPIICQSQEDTTRYPILLNMVHHNPGEPKFETQYTEPAYVKAMGYTGQMQKIEVQCGLTYDTWEDNVVPEKSEEKLWIELYEDHRAVHGGPPFKTSLNKLKDLISE